MIESLKQGREGMLVQVAKNDVIANNLANAATSGFKRELARIVESEQEAVVAADSATDTTIGSYRNTGQPLDVAVDGDGFFVVSRNGEELLTRNGEFRVSDDGKLVTASGESVVGAGGEIAIDVTLGAPAIGPDGTVSVGGEIVGALKLVQVGDVNALTRQGANLFAVADEARQDVPAEQTRVMPGFVEGSNVNPVREMVDMIAAMRTYQANEKSVRAADEILDVMINRVGRAPQG